MRGRLQVAQDVQERVAVFAAGEADHNLVARLDHIEIVNRIAHRVAQAFVQFIVFQFGFAFVGHGRVLCAKSRNYIATAAAKHSHRLQSALCRFQAA